MNEGGIMNNQIPYFINDQNQFNNPNHMINNNIHLELEKIINKINRLEKNQRILENRLSKIEMNNNNNHFYNDDPNDMYII